MSATAKAPDSAKPTVTLPASPMDLGILSFRAQVFQLAAAKFVEASAAPGTEGARANAWLARADLHLHNVEEAEKAARKAIELDPSSAAAQSALAEVYFRQGKFSEAEDTARKLAQAKTADARTYLTLARLYWATANNQTAKSLIDYARKLDSADPDIFTEWAATLPRRERLDEWKKRLAGGMRVDDREQEGLTGAISILEDQEKQPHHTCKLTAKKLPAEIPLQRLMIDAQRIRGYGLAVKVNDTNSKLLVDTGASGILIHSGIAEKAGVVKIADSHIGGIGDKGAASGYVGFANKLQIGPLVFEDCYIDVVDKKSSLNVDGLIGTDVFADFLVEVNFPDAKLALSELPPFPDETAVNPALQLNKADRNNLHNRWIPPQFSKYERIYRFGHFLLIPGQINASPPKLFMIDTGGWDNFITPAAAQGFTKVHSDYGTTVKGLSGKVANVYSTGDVNLTFGNFRQYRNDLVAFDLTHLSNDVGTEVSGSLGFAMLFLLDIKIDYRDHLVDFSYDPNRFH